MLFASAEVHSRTTTRRLRTRCAGREGQIVALDRENNNLSELSSVVEIHSQCHFVESNSIDHSTKLDANRCLLEEFDTPAYSIFERQNMLVSFYDEIIDSTLHIVDRLDLSVEKDKPEVRDRHPCRFLDGERENLE